MTGPVLTVGAALARWGWRVVYLAGVVGFLAGVAAGVIAAMHIGWAEIKQDASIVAAVLLAAPLVLVFLAWDEGHTHHHHHD